MDFRRLEVFRAIAEELHFGRAAQRLFMAQPSVTQQLQRLEAEVGVRLIERSSRQVRLTPAGRVYLAEVDLLFAASERAIERARAAAAGLSEPLRIATNYPASRILLLPLLEQLRRDEPHFVSALSELGTPEQLRALRQGELDVALVYGPVNEPGIHETHLIDVPVVANVRPGHPLASSDQLSLHDIDRYPYLTGYVGGSTVIEESLMQCAARLGVTVRRSASRAGQPGYLLELETTDTVGFSSAPRGEQIRAGGMHLLRLTPEEPVVRIFVAWSQTRDEPLVNTFVQSLRDLAKTIGAL